MDNGTNETEVILKFLELLNAMETLKPNDRSEQDRYWAIARTDVEKAYAVFETFVAQDKVLG